jgi:hypothetical protein
MEGLLPFVLVAQGLMAGVDTVLNHELLARLPKRPAARPELALHVVREAVWAALFAGLAWFAWHGALAWVIAALLALEIGITARDELIENRIRVLPQNERVLHLFLALNVGILLALLVPLVLAWSDEPTGLQRRDHGALSWVITAFAAAAAFWSVRDLVAWRRLRASVAA